MDLFTVESLHACIANTILKNEKSIFLHANAHLVELANTREKWLMEFFKREGNYVMCDGSGVQFAARLTRQKVPRKIPYNTWMWEFVGFLAKHNFTVFFLGADDRTIKKAVTNLVAFEPDLKVAGFHHGYFDKRRDSPDNLAVIEKINQARPQVLLIGFGMPAQELWLNENFSRLSPNAVFTCGGAFDFFAGNKTVAPLLFRKLFLEWLYRLMLEPKRLLKRYTAGNLRFLYIIMKSMIRN